MRECPWCGYQNLNVYAYCLQCGRGFSDPHPERAEEEKNGQANGAAPRKGFFARLLGR